MTPRADTHSKLIGYALWIFGFTGSHRFYYGKPVTGTIWFFTLGLLGIGWLIDLFLIPSMDRQADLRFQTGHVNYSVAWLLLTFLGLLGLCFSADPKVPRERFETLKRELGQGFEAIEIDSSPGNKHGIKPSAHSVLTVDLVRESGHPTEQALQRTLAFLAERLK